MNSNGKIIFGGFIAVSAVVVLLLFSMQNSAQLKLDIEEVKQTVAEKEAAIAAINSELEAAKSETKTAITKNQLIPDLRNNLETTEQEKLVYIQQLDDFQSELQHQVDIAEKRLAEITALQTQQEEQQKLLAERKETIETVDQQKTELNTALMSTLAELELQKHALEQTLDTLGQKDRVIQIYKEKLDKSAEEIMMLQNVDSSEQLNLKLVLDELAAKNQFVQDLPSNCKPGDDPAAEKSETPVAKAPSILSNETDQALIEKLSLTNDNLETELKKQQETIEDLQSKIAASAELSSSYATESEQLLLTGKAREDEIRLLKHKISGLEASLTEINATITTKEQAVKAAREQTQGIAAPLTEKISGLELQLSQLANRQAAVTNELSEARVTITTLQNDKQIISDELNSTKTALATLQGQTDKLIEELAAATASLEAQQDQASKLNKSIINKRKALTEEAKSNKMLAREVQTLKHSLALSKDDITRLTNISASFDQKIQECTASQIKLSAMNDKLENTIMQQEATLQKLNDEYRNRTAQFMEVRDRLSTAGAIKLRDIDTIHQHEARIARLIEEIAEETSVNKSLRVKNKELMAALNDKQADKPAVKEAPVVEQPPVVEKDPSVTETPVAEPVQEEVTKEDVAVPQKAPEAEEKM